ncbi:MAG: DUF1003 domain-containing protein [Janthinobacterium lividum]
MKEPKVSERDSNGDSLPEHISQQIDTIAALHARGESAVSVHQRTIEKVTAFLGRPLFLNLTIAAVALWVVLNLSAARLKITPFDPAPFSLLGWLVSTGGLLLTIVVLITQNRQARLAERRAQLDLQVNLLAEQKIAKLIALIEELRRDIPSVRNRQDLEAEAMSEAADAHAVLDALEEKLDALEEKIDATPGDPP